jgi:hypothetical protein
MKWGIVIVALVIAGATYYFWQQSHFDADGSPREKGTQIQTEVKTRMSEDDPEKYIPPNTIMEDGTI